MKFPTAPGTKIKQANSVKIDYSNINEGYVMVKNDGDKSKQYRLRVQRNNVLQHFTLQTDGIIKAFPLCFGNGKYCISVLKQIQGTNYGTELSLDADVKLSSEFAPYLYPNTYSNYKISSKCVLKASEICKGLYSDVERIRAINNWIISYIEYDYNLVAKMNSTNMSWWLPDPDTVIYDRKSICWGYASLFAAMCRSQSIPCRICVGWSGKSQKTYHAWNDVYSKVNGDITGIKIYANKWNRMDVTYMDSTRNSGWIYVSDDSNYKADYYG
jgi:hypothetical protein